jgi:hypothetical protein
VVLLQILSQNHLPEPRASSHFTCRSRDHDQSLWGGSTVLWVFFSIFHIHVGDPWVPPYGHFRTKQNPPGFRELFQLTPFSKSLWGPIQNGVSSTHMNIKILKKYVEYAEGSSVLWVFFSIFHIHVGDPWVPPYGHFRTKQNPPGFRELFQLTPFSKSLWGPIQNGVSSHHMNMKN